MRSAIRVVSIVVAGAALAFVPACGKSGPAKTRVAIVTNCTASFWTICEAGATKAANEHDVELDFRQPKTLSVSDQKELIDAVTKRGVSGIAVSVINPEEQTPYLKRLSTQTNYLAMDNDAPESGRVCYIGIDNYEAGKAVGRLVKQALPNGGTVALFIGGTASANAKARVGGVIDELAGAKDAKGEPVKIKADEKGMKYGKYVVYNESPYTDGSDEAKAQSNAKAVIELLNGTPNVCLIGLYAYNPKHIVLAYRSKQKELKQPMAIAGFDEDDTTLDGIAKGEVLGTVVQDPFMYGYRSVEVLAGLAKGDKSKAKNDPIPYRVITKNGGPDETVNGILVKNLKVADFEQSLKDNIASAKK